MAGLPVIDYSDVELRKLPLSYRIKLGQILEINDFWKTLMTSVPSEVNPTEPKYTVEHMDLIERHGRKSGKSCGEILLDEWSTSGKIRPKVSTLYELLQSCQLYRAADYVATEILNIPIPERANHGPARRVDSRELEEGVESLALQNDINFNTQPTIQPNILNNFNTESTQIVQDQTQSNTDNEPTPLKNLNTIVEKLKQFNANREKFKGHLTNVSIEIIEKLTNNFNPQHEIGAGSFGKVYKIQFLPTQLKLAVKLINPTGTVIEQQFITEIQVLSLYQHENLVALFGYSSNSIHHCLIYEFVPNDSLLNALSSNSKIPALNWNQRIEILNGIAAGIHHLHTALEKPLVHRDIKSANVLLTENLTAKIGDFGLAKHFTSNQTSLQTSTIFGTSAYMAPEAFRGDISPKMDIFSLGVIILEILSGLPPFEEERDGNDIVTYLEENIMDNNIMPHLDQRAGPISEPIALQIYTIAQSCLEDKKRRPNSTQILGEFKVLARFNDVCDINGQVYEV